MLKCFFSTIFSKKIDFSLDYLSVFDKITDIVKNIKFKVIIFRKDTKWQQ